MIDGISHDMLKNYLKVREEIDCHIEAIAAHTSLLSHYKECAETTAAVDLYALGYVHEILNSRAYDILEALDRFLPLMETKVAVMEGGNRA